jgi:hypothetical protein
MASHVVMRLLIAGMAHMMGPKTTEMTVPRCGEESAEWQRFP